MTKFTSDDLFSMYGNDDNDDAPRAQPEQLRLAGRATLIPHQGSHVPLARIEYVETLEATIRAQQRMLDDLTARLKKLEHRMTRVQNIADRKLDAVVSQIRDSNRWG